MSSDTRTLGLNQGAATNSVSQIKHWYDVTVPSPTRRHMRIQLALHFENTAEMLKVLCRAGNGPSAQDQLSSPHNALSYLERQIKASNIDIELGGIDRVTTLKVLRDQVVASIGLAHFLRLDIEGALAEVALTNVQERGNGSRPIFNTATGFSQRPTLRNVDFAHFV